MKKNYIIGFVMLCLILTQGTGSNTSGNLSGNDSERSVETLYTLFNGEEVSSIGESVEKLSSM